MINNPQVQFYHNFFEHTYFTDYFGLKFIIENGQNQR